ncbi:MAG: MFS transporter [Burkholderiaceae bacterium]
MKPLFYGWWVVAACVLFATISWSLGVFGMGVYVYALTQGQGFSISTVSIAVTSAYLVGASCTVMVGRVISRRGPRPVVAVGIVVMAAAVAALPYCGQRWQLHLAFVVLGLGMACLSTNTIGSTLAPWFERFQGRAMSTAMLGASIGGMIGTPLLIAGIRTWGFQTTTAVAAAVALIAVLPLAVWVLKSRPEDIGQCPDGIVTSSPQAVVTAAWGLGAAIATRQFRSHVVAFGAGLMIQIGFLSHHVPIAIPVLGVQGAATAVLVAAVAAFVGRLLQARYADRIDARKTAAGMLLLAAASLVAMALLPGAWALMVSSITYGLTIGNVTTLAPMVIRREFGAASFGVVFGLAAMLNQLAMAIGPMLFGVLRDLFGSYRQVLLMGSVLDVAAAFVIVWGGRRALVSLDPRRL